MTNFKHCSYCGAQGTKCDGYAKLTNEGWIIVHLDNCKNVLNGKEERIMLRPSWDSIYMNLAKNIAKRSTCKRLHVGSVVVSMDNTRVLSIGYNGNVSNGPNTCDSDEPGNCGCVHAETNNLIKLNFSDPFEKKMYITTSPCKACAKLIVNAKINCVYFAEEYRNAEPGLKILRDYGIKYMLYKGDEDEDN